jgi:hypothetical protein
MEGRPRVDERRRCGGSSRGQAPLRSAGSSAWRASALRGRRTRRDTIAELRQDLPATWSRRDGKLIRKTFTTEAEALLWREDARVDLRRGVLVAPKPTTLRQVGDRWLKDAEKGNVRNRSGDRYKPSSLRGYEQALRKYIYPAIGGVKLQDLRPPTCRSWPTTS